MCLIFMKMLGRYRERGKSIFWRWLHSQGRFQLEVKALLLSSLKSWYIFDCPHECDLLAVSLYMCTFQKFPVSFWFLFSTASTDSWDIFPVHIHVCPSVCLNLRYRSGTCMSCDVISIDTTVHQPVRVLSFDGEPSYDLLSAVTALARGVPDLYCGAPLWVRTGRSDVSLSGLVMLWGLHARAD